MRRLIDGDIVWAPAIEGGLLLTTRGGDFVMDIGQDISIGYLNHTGTDVELYLQESFTFSALTSEATVTLLPPEE
ncbi:TPA: encapsulin [Escherichia coli]